MTSFALPRPLACIMCSSVRCFGQIMCQRTVYLADMSCDPGFSCIVIRGKVVGLDTRPRTATAYPVTYHCFSKPSSHSGAAVAIQKALPPFFLLLNYTIPQSSYKTTNHLLHLRTNSIHIQQWRLQSKDPKSMPGNL